MWEPIYIVGEKQKLIYLEAQNVSCTECNWSDGGRFNEPHPYRFMIVEGDDHGAIPEADGFISLSNLDWNSVTLVLNDGTSNIQPSEAACRAQCASLAGCAAGLFLNGTARRGECWLSGAVRATPRMDFCGARPGQSCAAFRKAPTGSPTPPLINMTRRLQGNATSDDDDDGASFASGQGLKSSEQCHMQHAATEYCLDCTSLGCLGGSLCDEGYTGDACSDCVQGWFQMPVDTGTTTECLVCPDTAWITVTLMLTGFLCVCATIYKHGHNTGAFASVGVIITHFQLVSSFTLFAIPWPPVFAKFTAWLGAVFTFDLRFVAHPECAAKFSHLKKWLLFLSTPAYFVVTYALYYCCRYAWCWLRHRKRRDHHAWMQLVVVKASCMRATLQILFIMYIYIVQHVVISQSFWNERTTHTDWVPHYRVLLCNSR